MMISLCLRAVGILCLTIVLAGETYILLIWRCTSIIASNKFYTFHSNTMQRTATVSLYLHDMFVSIPYYYYHYYYRTWIKTRFNSARSESDVATQV